MIGAGLGRKAARPLGTLVSIGAKMRMRLSAGAIRKLTNFVPLESGKNKQRAWCVECPLLANFVEKLDVGTEVQRVIPSILRESMEVAMMGERSGSQGRFFYRFPASRCVSDGRTTSRPSCGIPPRLQIFGRASDASDHVACGFVHAGDDFSPRLTTPKRDRAFFREKFFNGIRQERPSDRRVTTFRNEHH